MTISDFIIYYKKIQNFPDYRIGTDGSVWSKKVKKQKKMDKNIWRRLKPRNTNKYGHKQVALYKNNKPHFRYVHYLVLSTFASERPKGMECLHINGNPADNRLENLKWGTHSENMRHSIIHGTSTKGEKSNTAKLKERQVICIRKYYKKYIKNFNKASIFYALSSFYKVDESTIRAIITRKSWKHI